MNRLDIKEKISNTAFSWLGSKVSLTKRLREFTHNRIAHHLFYDDWDQLPDLAALTLNLDPQTKAWIRKMQWRLDNQVWVDCTVIIPESSITKKTEILQHIGTSSIGDTLFQDTTLTRSDFQFIQHGNTNWTRYSIFHFHEQPLIITETFLPDFFRAIEATP